MENKLVIAYEGFLGSAVGGFLAMLAGLALAIFSSDVTLPSGVGFGSVVGIIVGAVANARYFHAHFAD